MVVTASVAWFVFTEKKHKTKAFVVFVCLSPLNAWEYLEKPFAARL